MESKNVRIMHCMHMHAIMLLCYALQVEYDQLKNVMPAIMRIYL